MLGSSDQCHESLIAQKAQAWQEGAGWLAHGVPVILNNSSSNVNEHPSCGGKRGWQFARDSTTFLWLSLNLNPSPLTTLFQTDQDMTDEFQLLKFISDSTTPARTSMSIKRAGFFKLNLDPSPLTTFWSRWTIIAVAWFSTLHLDPIIKSLAAVQAHIPSLHFDSGRWNGALLKTVFAWRNSKNAG